MTSTDYDRDPLDDPDAFLAHMDAQDDEPVEDHNPQLMVDRPPNDVVDLPGGIIQLDGGIKRRVIVRELTGRDEERLAKALPRGIGSYINELMRVACDPPLDEMTIDNLLIGDRDAILLGLRRITFGDNVSLGRRTCQCGAEFDIEVDLATIEMRPMDDPANRIITARGKKSTYTLRLPKHADQMEVSTRQEKRNRFDLVESNSVIIGRCLRMVDGVEVEIIGDGEELARDMVLFDRDAVLDALLDNQPGPELEGVKVTCPECDAETTIDIDLPATFRF